MCYKYDSTTIIPIYFIVAIINIVSHKNVMSIAVSNMYGDDTYFMTIGCNLHYYVQ